MSFQCLIGQPIAFLNGWWCSLGVSLSAMMLVMVWFHAHRHVVRLTIVPGVMDDIIFTTHNLLGAPPRAASVELGAS
jgi:hypothetical protein